MKIAIIGTSPLMLIVANELRKKFDVTIFDEKKFIGGAWSFKNFENNHIARQTNVIIPNRKSEDGINIRNINKFFEKLFRVKIKEDKKKYRPIVYKAKKFYKYNVRRIISLANNFKIVKKKITNVEIKKNKIYLNKSLIFDKLYIPTFTSIDKIKKGKKTYSFKPTLITSKHLFIVLKKNIFKNLTYSENFNEYFDRIQITNKKKYSFITSRVRREHKDKSKKFLIKKSLVFKKSNIKYSEICKYKNFYRNNEQEKNMLKAIKSKNIEYINTRQFVEGFIDLNNKLKLLNNL